MTSELTINHENTLFCFFRSYPILFCIILYLAVMITSYTTLEAEPLVLDFEQGGLVFKPVSSAIAISLEKGSGAPDNSGTSLWIRGTSSRSAYFAESDWLPMEEFSHYRLSAWIKAGSGNPEQLPYTIQCVFITDDPRSSLGFATGGDDGKNYPNSWQKVTIEFRTPLGTKQCKLVLAPVHDAADGKDAPGTIDIFLDTITLEPIDHYTISEKYTLQPFPESLQKMRGVHPRLYLTSERINELRGAIKTTHASLWEEFQRQADDIAKKDPPKYKDKFDPDDVQQLWMRTVGNNIPILAFAYVLSGEKQYLDSSVKWALASCSYPTWGIREHEGTDLSTGHQLFGLAMLYDWCYHDLSETTKATIRETLMSRGSYIFDAGAKGKTVKTLAGYLLFPWIEWDEAYLQNHLWINSCGIAAAGLALFDEFPETTKWMAFALDKYAITMDILGDDGASHEGPSYWTYGVAWMLKFIHLARELLEVDMYNHPWWQNTAYYRLHMSLPRDSWRYNNTMVNYGDSFRADSKGADYMLRKLASEYHDGYAQWLANALDDDNVAHPRDPWLNLLWYDPSVTPKPPSDLPTLHHFTDIDIASARSDWSGNESLVFFKCGPYLGHKAIHKMTYCLSSAHHVHPDVNSFMLIGAGDWLMRDDGTHYKYTGYHNTLLVDGSGQYGEGGDSFDGIDLHGLKICPRITCAESTPLLDHLTGDATVAYPAECGLQRFVRHLLFLKPDVLIVVDDIALDSERQLELRFHPEQQKGEREDNTFTFKGKNALLSLDLLTSMDVTLKAEDIDAFLRTDGIGIPRTHPMYTVRMMTKKKEWRNAVALSWSQAGEKPVKITLVKDELFWTFSDGKRTVKLNLENGIAQVLH